MPLSTPTLLGAAVTCILLWTLYGCLRTIAQQYEQAVAWHNLKVRAHRLRLHQQRRLEALKHHEQIARRPPAAPRSVAPLEMERARAAGAVNARLLSPGAQVGAPIGSRNPSSGGEIVAEAIPLEEVEHISPTQRAKAA